MNEKAKFSPMGENDSTQVVDNTELGITNNSPWAKFSSDMEVVGAIKQQLRMNQFSESTLIIELAKVQSSYRSAAVDMRLLSSAQTFKEFVEVECGLNYKTITSKISHMKKLGPQLLQMFEQLGVPMTLQRQIKALPSNLRKKLDSALAGSPAQSADEVAEVFKELTAHTVALQDRLDEAEMKTKSQLIEERDQAKDHFELAEERMINMNEQMEKQQDRIKGLLASQKIDDKTIAVRKINDTLRIFFKALEGADLSDEDLDLRYEKSRFLELLTEAREIGLS